MASQKLAEQEQKPLHEVVDIIYANCLLQTNGSDVAIPYIQGNPGGGKTASVGSVARENGWHVLSTHFALKMLEELGGIPQFTETYVNGEKRVATEWSFPDIMRTLYLLSDHSNVLKDGGVIKRYKSTKRMIGAFPNASIKEVDFDKTVEVLEEVKGDGKPHGVIWLLDDMHLCGPVHMSMLYELLTERKLREYKIPDNVGIILCGNTSQKAGAKTTFSAIVNRCMMLPVYTDFAYWKNIFAIPNEVHPVVISFLSNSIYNKFFHEEEMVDKPWASPRAWTRFSNLLKTIEDQTGKKVASDDLAYLAASHVGKSASGDFVSYYKIFTNFDMKKIYENYKKFEIPKEPVQQYALAYAIVTEFCGVSPEHRKKEKYAEKLAHFVNAFKKSTNNVSELAIMILKELVMIEKTTGKGYFKEAMQEIMKIDPQLVHSAAKDMITFGK